MGTESSLELTQQYVVNLTGCSHKLMVRWREERGERGRGSYFREIFRGGGLGRRGAWEECGYVCGWGGESGRR